MGSHTPLSEHLSLFLDGGCCYAMKLSCLKLAPITLCSARHFTVGLVFSVLSVCCDTAQALVFSVLSVCCDTAQALVFSVLSVCCDTAQARAGGNIGSDL